MRGVCTRGLERRGYICTLRGSAGRGAWMEDFRSDA